MGNKYVIESEFDDLHGNPDDGLDLDLDLSDSENPIISAALSDEDWTPPEDDDEKPEDDEDKEEDEEEEEADDSDEEEEDEDSDSDDDDEEEDEDDDKYSKNVQKRIDRERDARKRDKAASDREIAKLKRQATHRDAKDEFAETERDAEKKLRRLKKKKVDALEEGNTTEVVDIDEEILDVKADLKTKKVKLDQLRDNIDVDDEPAGSGGTPEAGKRWLEKYPQFHTNSKFRNVVLQVDKMVASRGLDKNSDRYYEEMEKVLKPQFPEIVKTVKVTNRRKRKQVKKKRSAVGGTTKPGTRGSKRKRSSGGRIRLTKQDQKNMETFGLDPSNPEHLKEWAANKGAK